MKAYLLVLLSCIVIYVEGNEPPVRKYRYESKDVMDSAATTVPLRSYRSIQQGFYPQGGGILNGYSDIQGYGGQSFTGGGSGIGLGGGYGGYGGLGGGGGYIGGSSGYIGGGGGYIGGGNSIGKGFIGGGGGGLTGGGLIGGGGGLIGGGGGLIGGGAGLHSGIIGGGAGLQGGLIGGGAGLQNELIGGGAGLNGGYIGGGGLGIKSIGLQGGGLGLGGGYIGGGQGGFIGGGQGGFVGGGHGGFTGGSGFIGGGQGGFISPIHHSHGGESIDKSIYSDQKKNLNDGSYEKAGGQSGVQSNQGQNGFNQGKIGVQNSKGDLGYYNDAAAGKKVVEDGKSYAGGRQFNQEGQNSDQKKQEQGHKKGHVVKGFKSSHHKDETGKTEEFYDEAHDQGDNFNFNGQNGKFGEGSQASFKGGHDDRFFNADEKKKQGQYNTAEFLNKNNANQGQYGQNNYLGNGQIYGVNNGIDQQSLLGHHEHNRFFKHHPYFHG